MRPLDIGKILLGVLSIFIGLYVYRVESESTALAQSFSEEPVTVLGLSSQYVPDVKYPIHIRAGDISLPVRKASVVSGYWEVFEDSAAWGEGSGIPGEIGNIVIFAHAKEGLFLPLRTLTYGDIVTITTKEAQYMYLVTDIKEVSPKDTSVIGTSTEEIVTLYTCSGYRDTKRLIVTAKRIQEDLQSVFREFQKMDSQSVEL